MVDNKEKLINATIVGNPNVGKSVIFNNFTNTYTDVSNYPGTTVEAICGRSGNFVFSDTPGTYGLSGFTEEERLARDIVLRSDMVINVVDATHLERDLFLTQHLIDAGLQIVVALNLMDEAEEQGIYINVEKLEEELGVPVIPTVAVNGDGMEKLLKLLCAARVGNITPGIMENLSYYKLPQRESLLVAEGDLDTANRNNCKPGNRRDLFYRLRRDRVNGIVASVVREITVESSMASRIGHIMLHPVTGIPMLLLTLFLIYQLIGVVVAQTLVGYTEEIVMGGMYQPFIRNLLSGFISEQSTIWSILAGKYGLFTMAVTYLFGLLLPLVMGFQLVLSILEDSGYLPRIAVLMDRILLGMGLNGQAVIPMILGFGCVTMATMSTRMLGSDREKFIAIVILAFTVPCSAQMAIITSMMAGLGFYYALAYGLILFTIMVSTGIILSRLLPGSPSGLWIDLPPVRLPRLSNVLKKTWIKSTDFVQEAVPLFAGGALFLSVLEITGGLEAIENLLVPVTVNLLGLPKEVAGGFIMGFIRREFGTAGLFTTPMNPVQQFVALITVTFFVPCIATAMIIFKERGWKQGAAIWLSIFVLAFVVGGIVSKLISLINIMPGVSVMPVLSGITVLVLALVLYINWNGEESLSR